MDAAETSCLNLTCHDNMVSLQDSFRQFRDMKKRERQILKLARNGEFNGDGERTDAFKNALREKFIDAAKRYLGVPYAKRFKADDVPEAPLYLDCCALVRRAVTDLQDDFGIVLGKWNQAYQMDTLPIVLQQNELRPGDLIFYEGLYSSNRSKSQKHNNVHVEIFLGGETGEATIGSRYHRGQVSIFPSFKFTSTTWNLVQYHFRSLDTWLNGECRSHCLEHRWHSDILSIEAAAGKRSIFNDNSDDESAGGDNESDCEEASNTEVDDSKSSIEEINESPPSEWDNALDIENLSRLNDALPASIVVGKCRPFPSISATPSNWMPMGAKQATQRPMSAAREAFSDKSNLGGRAVPATGMVVGKRGGAAREGLGLIPGSLILQPRLQSQELERQGVHRVESKAAVVTQGKDTAKALVPLTYYVGKSNGWRLVKDSLDKRGWQQLPFEYSFSSRFNLKWVERRSQIDFKAHTVGQLVNHIPNNDCISTKLGLLKTLREKYCRVSAGSTVRRPTPWLPETYQLDSPADLVAAFEVESQLIQEKIDKETTLSCDDVLQMESCSNQSSKTEISTTPKPISLEKSGCLWIYKPSCNNRGRGIKVVRGVEALQTICYGKDTGDPATTISPSQGILQRYVENPLLVGAAALKFDVRCYMLVACNDPYTAFYHPGYCRLSLKSYSTSDESLEDPTVHLTNASVQKKHPLYEQNKELQIRTIADVADEIERSGDLKGAQYLRTYLDEDIMQCMVDVLKAAMSKLIRKKGYFDLFGFDFMVSTCPERKGRLVLLEVNTNPALSLDNSTLAALLPGVVDGTIDLVLKVQGPEGGLSKGLPTDAPNSAVENSDTADPAPPPTLYPSGFRLLYDELSGFEFKRSLNSLHPSL